MHLNFDINSVPFSRYGSYLSITNTIHPQLGPGIYLRTHHSKESRIPEIFKIELLINGQYISNPMVEGTPSSLKICHKESNSFIEILIMHEDKVLIRGKNATLRLRKNAKGGIYAYIEQGKRYVINARDNVCKIMITTICGECEVDSPWNGIGADRIVVDIKPSSDGEFLVLLEYFLSTCPPYCKELNFDKEKAEIEREFLLWLKDIPHSPAKLESVRNLAGYILWSSVIRPYGLLKRPAMLMSKNWMTSIWSWDNCFNAMALIKAHPDLAYDQFMIMADFQDEYGAYPDAVNDFYIHFNYCKPPVHGWATDFCIKKNNKAFNEEKLKELYSSLRKLTLWWIKYRTWENTGLPYYIHGNDSGWDNSTIFDYGVPIATPDLISYLILQSEFLAKLAYKFNYKKDNIYYKNLSSKLLDTLLKNLWNGKNFTGLILPNCISVECDSLITCIPVILNKMLPGDIIRKVVNRIKEFLTPYGLASELPSSKKYIPDGYWRGPIWAPSTMLIYDGLKKLQYNSLANVIARRFCSMCSMSGFAENFEALTGKALRDKAYTWTASVFLILSSELK